MSKKVDNKVDLSEIVLFKPRNGKSITKSYKEIKDNPKFRGLADNEVHFAWLIGIPNSPVDPDLPSIMRWRVAAAESFGKNPKKKVDFSEGNFGDEVKEAIDEFSKFSPEARWIANKINQTAIKKFLEMANAKDEDFFHYRDIKEKDPNTGETTVYQVKEVDYGAKKQYTDMMAQISRTMPELLRQSEDGFGITEEKKTEMVGTKPIDDFHQEKKDKTSH